MNRRHFIGLVATAVVATAAPTIARSSEPSARVLRLYHLNTKERLDIEYRVGDVYQRGALRKLNYLLRDFRNGEMTAMDPQLFDLLYDIQNRLSRRDAVFEVIGGYRSPSTNAMMRKTSGGVARQSLHTTGQAIDIRMTDTATIAVRNAALALGRGGVGYYPRSDFVHVDTGPVRHWGA